MNQSIIKKLIDFLIVTFYQSQSLHSLDLFVMKRFQDTNQINQIELTHEHVLKSI